MLGRPWPACEEQWWCEQSLVWPCRGGLEEPGKLSPGSVIPSDFAMDGLVPVLRRRVRRAQQMLDPWSCLWGSPEECQDLEHYPGLNAKV